MHTGGKDMAWRNLMEQRAEEAGFPNSTFKYLNAGIMAGRARDLTRLFEAVQQAQQAQAARAAQPPPRAGRARKR